MKNYTRILSILTLALLTIALPVSAQEDNKNKAIVETTEGTQQLNTDDISVIRFDSGKITIEQPWGNTTYDRTLRSLTFFRPLPGTLRLTATTDISANDGGNRAQVIDGDGKLKATWEEGDVVYVYAAASSTAYIGTLTPKSYGASTATLTGDINAEGLSNGQDLYFSTKDRATFNLTSQDGTVESLFYFEATAPVTIDGGNASVGDLSFARPIAVVKFTLKEKADGTTPINTSSLSVNDGTNTYTVTPTSATNVLYVGIPAISSKTVTLTATDGNEYYQYQKTGVSFTNNLYYAINVKMQASDLARPLTFEAINANTTVAFSKGSNAPSVNNIEYSIDGGTTWQEYTYGTSIQLASVGNKVSFRGTNTCYGSHSNESYCCKFSCSDDCYIYGNIMSIINKNNYAINTTLTGTYSFSNLFNNTKICNHPTKSLNLPATSLTYYCYYKMFYGCTKLTTAPVLPATTLASGCYKGMFQGCTGLTSAPELSATTLTNSCYYEMFSGCTNLQNVTCLATSGINTNGSTRYWLSNVKATGTFTKATGASWPEGRDGIPSGWTTIDYEKTLPLTFEAVNNGTTITFKNKASGAVTYTVNGGASQTIAASSTENIAVDAGDKVCFYGDNATYSQITVVPSYYPEEPPYVSVTPSNITSSADCYVYGNIMSLVNSTGYATATELTGEHTFQLLFNDYYKSQYIKNHPSKSLVLPATTLTAYCYTGLFRGCENLTTPPALPATTLAESCYADMFLFCENLATAPELPATTLAKNCYEEMFYNCTSLTTAPALPATTLEDYCYYMMFDGCTNLSSAPELPATTMKRYCYSQMFNRCSSLTTAPALPATTLAPYCYNNMFRETGLTTAPALPATTLAEDCYSLMFRECASLTTAPTLPATTLAEHCYSQMFYECPLLTTAPTLPAATLKQYCYYQMFYGCFSLNSVTCMATDISADYCTDDWLSDVAATGTFTKPASMTSWGSGASGIPSGWTVTAPM